jgi:hypothetical protein
LPERHDFTLCYRKVSKPVASQPSLLRLHEK